jgi:hypothetical protein
MLLGDEKKMGMGRVERVAKKKRGIEEKKTYSSRKNCKSIWSTCYFWAVKQININK